MLKLLAIGDSHIPRRTKEIPSHIYDKLETLTEKNLFEYTFFTGDVINAPKFLDFLNLKTKRDLFIVLGNMDYYGGNRNAPIYQKLEIPIKENDSLAIGLTHGTQISPRGDHTQLELLASERNYHVLISGHTHHEEVFLSENGTLLLNPGSVTGAWSFVASGNPSFLTLTLEESNSNIDIDLYVLNKKNNRFEERSFYLLYKNNTIHNRY
ncbi:MAG: YfcE family phosphodiesterase [Candidatus Lokiarchaeota archaeon]|nr:YfcE family phosphodiesterase [Candidatus Lokiarchaeota archaeon]